MAKNDGKNKFYRQLRLDRKTRNLIKWFSKVKEQMQNEKQ